MTPDPCRLHLKFWGVRGSTPTPIAENLGCGGNTSCLEIGDGNGQRIIIDGGTGIRSLGNRLAAEKLPLHVNLFFTHFHWDHIQGIPFFLPLFGPDNRITFHSFPSEDEIRHRLERQMSSPFFTLDFNQASAAREYRQVEEVFRGGAIVVTAFPLHHPQGACGYRIESRGAAIVVATDFEHGDPVLDKVLREHAEGADLLIYDAQYTPQEYAARKGWGHSNYAEACRVAADAKVKKLALFHHDPTHDDAAMDAILEQAKLLFENTMIAQERQDVII